MIKCFKGISNTYLINKLLIDAGFLVREKVDVIVITHCHYDHIIHANKLKKLHKCKIAASRETKKHIEKMDNHVLSGFFTNKAEPVKVDIVLKKGDKIKAGNMEFTVLETPGHVDGSICLYEPEKQILFSGDTWFEQGVYGRTDLPGSNAEKLGESVKMLKKLKIRKMYAGH